VRRRPHPPPAASPPIPIPPPHARRCRLLQLRPHCRRGAPAPTWPQPPASPAWAGGALAACRCGIWSRH
jgi:hypothetical protein